MQQGVFKKIWIYVKYSLVGRAFSLRLILKKFPVSSILDQLSYSSNWRLKASLASKMNRKHKSKFFYRDLVCTYALQFFWCRTSCSSWDIYRDHTTLSSSQPGILAADQERLQFSCFPFSDLHRFHFSLHVLLKYRKSLNW